MHTEVERHTHDNESTGGHHKQRSSHSSNAASFAASPRASTAHTRVSSCANTYAAGFRYRGEDVWVGDGVRVGRRGEQRPPFDRQPDQPRGPGRLIAGPDDHRRSSARRRRAAACGRRGLLFRGGRAHAIFRTSTAVQRSAGLAAYIPRTKFCLQEGRQTGWVGVFFVMHGQ